MSSIDVRILGPLQVVVDGGVATLGGPKQRSVLAMLAMEPNRVVSTDRLIDGVWGDEPHERAGSTLQVYVSNLRKVLGADRIVTQPPGYLLRLDDDESDLGRFETSVAAGESARVEGRLAEAASAFGAALDLWRGPAVADLVHEPFAELSLAGLDERRELVREAWFDVRLDLGQHVELVAEVESAVAAAPLRERRRGQLMVALYRAGRQADALKVFGDTRRVLVEELGIDPSPELRRLEARILDQDPALSWADGASPGEQSTTIRRLPGMDGASLALPNGTTLELSERSWVIGRAAEADIVLASPDVSRRHAELRPTEGGWVISDLGSTNGVRVGDRSVTEYQLGDGDEITIGRYRLVFRDPPG